MPRRLSCVLLCLGVTTGACKDDDEAPSASAVRAAPEDPEWTQRLQEPDVADILAALHQSHRAVREQIGPHRLAYAASFELAPKTAREAPPKVDTPAVDPHAVDDELTLVWAGEDDQGPQFSLSQGNDHDRGRDVVVKQGRLYSRLRPRAFTHHPLETTVYELWLDDAQHAVHDAVQFAAPGLAITAQTESGAGIDGDAVLVTLSAAEGGESGGDADGGAPDAVSGWRDAARFEKISGTVRIDAQTGAWLSAEVSLRYTLPGADGRQLRGTMALQGTVEPRTAQTAQVAAPAEAVALPERTRYEVERQELLDGLAAP